MAESGDTNILRFCLERLIPKAKDRPIHLALPKELGESKALLEIGNTILRDVANQNITPEQAKSLMSILAAYRDTSLFDKLSQEISEIKDLLNENN